MKSLYQQCKKIQLSSLYHFSVLQTGRQQICTQDILRHVTSWSHCGGPRSKLPKWFTGRTQCVLQYKQFSPMSGRASRSSQDKHEQRDAIQVQVDHDYNTMGYQPLRRQAYMGVSYLVITVFTSTTVYFNAMHRLSAENDMLSRCRNTYIMTLVSITAMQLKLSPLPATIGAVAIITAELNLALATILYLVTLFHNWRVGKVSTFMLWNGTFFAVAHYILWSMVLVLLFPDGKIIDKELKRYAADDPDFWDDVIKDE